MILLLISCAKELDQFIPDTVVLDFEDEFGEKEASNAYLIDGRRDTIITTPGGTEFEFYVDVFEYEDGSTCPCEELEVFITELNDPKDFITSLQTTGTSDRFIAVEGMYNILVKHEGQKLKLKDGIKLHYHDRGIQDEAFEVYFGSGTAPNLDWQPVSSSSEGYLEFASDIDGYETYVSRLGWSAIAKDLNMQGITSVCVDLDLLTHDNNAMAFAIGADDLAVMPFYFDTDKECFCAYGLPLGLKMDLVVIRKSGDDTYHFSKQQVSITEDLEVHMEYDPSTKTGAEIDLELQNI